MSVLRLLEFDSRKNMIRVLPEHLEDLYYLSLIISPGDIVYAWTKRSTKVNSGYDSERGKRIRVFLGLRVEQIEFEDFSNRMRIFGVVVESPERIHAKGRHHTIIVDVGKELTIMKNRVLDFHINLIEESKRLTPNLMIVSIGDTEAVVGILRLNILETLATIEKGSVDPNAKKLRESYDKYFEEILKNIRMVAERINISIILILAPQLIGEWFKEYLKAKKWTGFKTVFAGVSEGGLAGIYEFMRSSEASTRLKGLKVLYEKDLVDKVFYRLVNDPDRLAIGLENVIHVLRQGAVDHLIILDTVARSMSNQGLLEQILELAEKTRAKISIIGSRNEAGIRLKSLGGIVALTRYKVYTDPS